MKTTVNLPILATLLLAATLLPAADKPAGGKDTATPVPARVGINPATLEKTREPENADTGLAGSPIEVNDDLLNSPNDEIAWVARLVKSGRANMVQLRRYYAMRKHMGPGGTLPDNWAVDARVMRDTLPVASPPHPVKGPYAVMAYNWTSLGPTNYNEGGNIDQGRATAIWVNPGNAAHWLVGFADGGVWKTTDSGTTWTPLFDAQATMSVGAIAVDPGNANIIYVGTGEGNFNGDGISGTSTGVYKSIDGGTSWTLYTIPWPIVNTGTSYNGPLNAAVRDIRRIAIDPNNTSILYAAASGGLMRSTNAGVTWTMLNSGGIAYTGNPANCNVGAILYVTDVIADGGTNPSTVYAAFGRPFGSAACTPDYSARSPNGIYRTSDAGTGAQTWTKIGAMGTTFPALAGCAGMGRLTLAMAPSNHQQLYVAVHKPGLESTCTGTTDSYTGTYMTTNARATPTVTWTQQSTTNFCTGQCWYDMTMAVDPATPATIYFGGSDAMYRSTNSGGTLTQFACGQGACGAVPYIHPDEHHLAFVNGTSFLAATDGGVFLVTTSQTVTSKNGGGLSTLQFYGIGQSPTNATQMHGGLQDNGEAYTATAPTGWAESAGGDGGFSATDQTTGTNAYEEYVFGSIERSTSSGSGGWSCIQNFGGASGCSGNTTPDGACEFIAPFTLDPNAQTVMFTGSKFIYRNSGLPSGTTWTKYCTNGTGVCTGAFNTGASALASEDITHIHVSKVGGKVCVTNTTSCNIWVGSNAGAIWKTSTGTNNYTRVDKVATQGTPARPVNWMVSKPSDTTPVQDMIVGYDGFNVNSTSTLPTPTAVGHIWRTANAGTAWTDISGTLPDVPVTALALDPADENSLYIGTAAGVYLMTNPWSATPTLANVTANLPNVAVFQLEFTNATVPKRLRAATHGRGIWELTITGACSAPSGFANNTAADASACAATGNTVTWSAPTAWGDTSGTRTYDVLRNGTPLAAGTGLSGVTTSFTDATAVVGTSYTYTVRSNNGCGSSTVTTPGASATDLQGSVPSGFSNNSAADANVCTLTGNTVTWTAPAWNDNSSGTRTYDVLRNGNPLAAGTGLSGVTVSFTDATAVAATAYTYTVRANNGCALNTTTTPGASATDNSDAAAPTWTANPQTVLKSSPNINFSWAAASDTATPISYISYSAATPNPVTWNSRNTTATLAWTNAADLAGASSFFYTTTAKDNCTNETPK